MNKPMNKFRTLAFALALLARNPEAQERIRAEAAAVLPAGEYAGATYKACYPQLVRAPISVHLG